MGRGAVIQCLGRNDSKESHMSGSINLTRIFFVKWTGYCTHIYWQIESGVVPRELRTTATAARLPAPLAEAAGCRIVDHQGAHTPGRPRTAVSGLAVAGGSGAPCGALPQTERAGGPRSFGASSVYARSPAPTLRASASSARTGPALAESGIWRESPLVARGPVPCR